MNDKIHDFDGITERQDTKTKIPLGLLIAASGLLIWAFYFFITYFPPISGWSALKEYESKNFKNAADINQIKPAEQANPFSENIEALEDGEEVFKENCSGCHGAKLEGGVGPALLKKKWIYGGDDASLFETVSKGRKGGMPPFESQLGQKKIWKVITFIQSKNK